MSETVPGTAGSTQISTTFSELGIGSDGSLRGAVMNGHRNRNEPRQQALLREIVSVYFHMATAALPAGIRRTELLLRHHLIT